MQGMFHLPCCTSRATQPAVHRLVTSDEVFATLGKLLQNLKIKKPSIGWNLEDLEAATQVTEERESDSDDESSDGSDSPALIES